MKSKLLIGLLIVGIIFISGCIQQEGEKVVEKGPPTEGELYKGIWLPTLLFQDSNHLASNAQKLKDTGVNTIFIQAFPPHSEHWLEKAKEVFPPELIKKIEEVIPIEKELIIANIQTAHRNGLKVGLTITKPLTISNPPTLEEIEQKEFFLQHLEDLNSKIIEYAQLAEEYDVELFAPMNEPDEIFSENTGKWRQDILPKIREVYQGEIVWKGAMFGLPSKTLSEEFLKELSEEPPGDFSGYDYIGFSIFYIRDRGMTLEEYSEHIDNVLKYALAKAERDNCKGVIITEFSIMEGGPWSEEEIVRAYEIVLERGKGKVVGFFAMDFLEVEIPGVPLQKEALKTEEVIRKWFTEIL